jgi:acetyl esterase
MPQSDLNGLWHPFQQYVPCMPVLPELQRILALVNDPSRPKTGTVPVADVRAGYENFLKLAGPAPALHSVEDHCVDGPGGQLPVRVYRPAPGVLPVLVWVHGGGWTIGSIETDNTRCAVMALRAGIVVVSVDYRLVPEHPFPAAINDTVAAVRWVAANTAGLGLDPTAIALGGDSAGGNLTAVAAQLLRDEGNSPLRLQLLVYPATDLRGDYPSMRDNAEGYYLTKAGMDWFELMYSPGIDATDPRRSPLLGKLDHLPAAHIITCEFDPLRDEGAAYATALQAAGVPCTHTNYDGMIHTCFGMEMLWPSTRVMMDDAVAALRSGLGLSVEVTQ